MKKSPLILPQSTLRIDNAYNSNERDAESRNSQRCVIFADLFCFHVTDLFANDRLQHVEAQVSIDREATRSRDRSKTCRLGKYRNAKKKSIPCEVSPNIVS